MNQVTLKTICVFSISVCLHMHASENGISLTSIVSSDIPTGIVDDLQDIELGAMPVLKADDFMPFISKSRNVTDAERRSNIEVVLARSQLKAQTKGRTSTQQYLMDLQTHVAKQRTGGIGLPIAVSEDHIKPALEWLGRKVLKEDLEVVNRKFDRQKIISAVSAIGAFVVSSGIACLTAYIGSLYS